MTLGPPLRKYYESSSHLQSAHGVQHITHICQTGSGPPWNLIAGLQLTTRPAICSDVNQSSVSFREVRVSLNVNFLY